MENEKELKGQEIPETQVEPTEELTSENLASQEETILVGLGVLFEEYYNSLDQTSKQHFLQSLSALL